MCSGLTELEEYLLIASYKNRIDFVGIFLYTLKEPMLLFPNSHANFFKTTVTVQHKETAETEKTQLL